MGASPNSNCTSLSSSGDWEERGHTQSIANWNTALEGFQGRGMEKTGNRTNLKHYKRESSNPYIQIHGLMGLFKLSRTEFQINIKLNFHIFASWHLGEKTNKANPHPFCNASVSKHVRQQHAGGMGSGILSKYKNTSCKCLSSRKI